MEIRNLTTFIKVAEAQSLSKAGKALGYAQSTVTMQMQQLEQELGTSLYERVGRSIRLTQEGQELLIYAVNIVKLSQEAMKIGPGTPGVVEGGLRLGISDTVSEEEMAELIFRFRKAYPLVELSTRWGDTQLLGQQLFRNEIDLMMTVDHLIQDPMLIHKEDRKEPVHFMVAPGHPLEKYSFQKKKESLLAILSYPLIRSGMGTCYERDLEETAALLGKPMQKQVVLENRNIGIQLVLRQEGVILLPDSAVKGYLEGGRLVALNYQLPGNGYWRQTMHHKNKWVTKAMEAWIKILEDDRG